MAHTNKSIVEAWAHKQTDDLSHGNIHVKGDTIYSYGSHFPAARHIDGIVLITNQWFSVTTSVHTALVRYAVNHIRSFEVPNVMVKSKPEHKVNYKSILADANEAMRKASTARSRRESLINQACTLTDKANQYSRFFKLGYKTKSINVEDLSTIRAKVKKQQAADLRKRKKLEAELKKQGARKIQKWRKGELDCLGNIGRYLPVTLRVKDGKVETSKGVNFPVEHAPLAWKVIKRCVDRGVSWKANGHTIKLGHYQVNSISSKGVLKAGCHTVPFEESQYIAELLNL